MNRPQRGFTLIELLVVISIIALLSSILLTSFGEGRSKARDAQRKAQVRQFMTALEFYYSIHGSYPCALPGACGNAVQHFESGLNAGLAIVSSGAISEIPPDPVYPSSLSNPDCNLPGFGYCYCSAGGNSYVITVNSENDEGGSDRCYIAHGPNTATLCQGHHGGPEDIAAVECSTRF